MVMMTFHFFVQQQLLPKSTSLSQMKKGQECLPEILKRDPRYQDSSFKGMA